MYIQVKKVMYKRLIRKEEYVVYIQVKKVMYERLIRKSMLCTSK